MNNIVVIGGRAVKISSLKPIGKGGEADIFGLDGAKILKLFKPPDHPDYAGDAPELKHERKGAANRIAEHQYKLPAFPKGLPKSVGAPLELAFAGPGPDQGKVCGYVADFVTGELLIRLSHRDSRQKGISHGDVVQVFKDLHPTVSGLHKAGVVIGDFNDLNGFVKDNRVRLIDVDSMQFGKFHCKVFTQKFVDPLLCDPKHGTPLLYRPHNENSDWYAYLALLMQSLLFVGPYGGVYQPKTTKVRVNHDERPMHRITVFNPEVRYPKPALPYSLLPDPLLQLFHDTFEKDKRGEFPVRLLDEIVWNTCPKCKLEHARFACPTCDPHAVSRVKETVTMKGTVKATTIFNKGVILAAVYQGGQLRYLTYENNSYRREDGSVVWRGPLDSSMRFRISGSRTIFGKGNTVVVIENGAEVERIGVESNGTMPLVDSNEAHYFYVRGGQLLHDAEFGGTTYVGDVLQGQNLFWVGPTFGFGFYWAGRLRVGFVFDAKQRSINDSVKLPPMRGQVIDTACYFSKDRAWFLWNSQENGRRINQCVVIRPNGVIEGHAQAEADDGSWLGTIRGKCAIGNMLLCATDEGIVQVKHETGTIVVAKKFPDTEPFVSTDVSLFVDNQGSLYVIKRSEITLLKIS